MNIHNKINLKHSCILRGKRENLGYYYLFHSFYFSEKTANELNLLMPYIKISKKYKNL